MPGTHVLVVEDNHDLSRLMVDHLATEGLTAEAASDALTALERVAAGGVDVIILDLMLPRLSGDRLLARLRERPQTRSLPVIVVSAKDTVWTKVDLLRMGADDYLTKPFDLDELIARIEAVLRRSRPSAEEPQVLSNGALTLETASRRVRLDGQDVALTPAEIAILEVLMSAPGRVATKASLARSLGEDPAAGAQGVKTHVSHLRAKLRAVAPGTDYVETVWGLGYRMAAPDGAAR